MQVTSQTNMKQEAEAVLAVYFVFALFSAYRASTWAQDIHQSFGKQ